MNNPDLLASVVVAVKDDQRVRRLLGSLLAQTMASDRYEVIVVENGSTVLSDVEGLGDGLVRYVHHGPANAAVARSVGLGRARGRYMLLTDSDCITDPRWIERMTDVLATGQFAAVGGVIRKHSPTTWVQRHAITIVDGQQRLSYLPALDLPYVAGANAGFDADKLREIGGFDPRLLSGNDVDVCYRLGLRGYRIGLAADAVVWHEDRADVGSHFRRFQHYARYQVALHAKYRGQSGRRLVIDTYPFRRAAAALRSTPRVLVRVLAADPAPALRAFLQLIEAAGVLSGELAGAVRYRQLYL